jgi:glycosyltransferase involved in cell wall biosynthesis
MKILLVNNHHKISGGAERYYFDLGRLLTEHGHKVAYFSMKDRENVKSRWQKYFVSNVDPNKSGAGEIFKKIPRIFFSVEAKIKISKLLDDFKPDIVHLQNIYYHISPSILLEIKKRGVPVLQTVHDYQIISPNVIMYHNGKKCEIFARRQYYKSIFHKCVGNSYIGSFLAVTGLYIQNFNDFYFKSIDAFVTPSEYMKRVLIKYGADRNKILQLNNFVRISEIKTSAKPKQKYILFFGRLTRSKGIFTLLDLARRIPGIKIIAAGNFDEDVDKRLAYRFIKNGNIRNFEFTGFKRDKDLKDMIHTSEFVVVPSEWEENQPYSVLESYALGKPVVASNIGGIREIVRSGETGLLFKTGDARDFESKVLKLWGKPELIRKMGKNARKFVAGQFNGELHYSKLNQIYKNLIKSR